jgi:hypothetical protein
LNHFTVPLAIHVVSAELTKQNEPLVPAHTGVPGERGYAGWGRLGSANGTVESAKVCQIGTNLRFFVDFALI